MVTTIEITVGDTGLTLSGTLNGGGLDTLAGSTVKLSIIKVDPSDPQLRRIGGNLITAASATITDAPNKKVAYKLQAGDVAAAGAGIIRWTATLPSAGGDVHFPGPHDQQVVLQINP